MLVLSIEASPLALSARNRVVSASVWSLTVVVAAFELVANASMAVSVEIAMRMVRIVFMPPTTRVCGSDSARGDDEGNPRRGRLSNTDTPAQAARPLLNRPL